MPIKVANNLPAIKILEEENIFIMTEDRAITQDIRPLKIVILNIMPTKIETETQLIRLLGNTSLQVDVDLLHMRSHQAKNVSQHHLNTFYKTFDEIKDSRYDGMIITGAPVEHMKFEDVDYWQELTKIMEWAKKNVWSTLHICWGAQAGLYYHYGIKKHLLKEKRFGIYQHRLLNRKVPLVRGFDDVFFAPHSRHAEVDKQDVLKHPELSVLAESKEAGIYLVIANDGHQVFVMGHPEYDRYTLQQEYLRDKEKGLPIEPPLNYYPDDDDTKEPLLTWRSHANILYSNWLNYYVYQTTPYEFIQTTK